MPFLSKSKIMAGLQCRKRLYLEVHHPELLDYSDEAEHAFSIGHEVGEAARTLHPGGKLIEHQGNLENALDETRQLLDAPGDVALFESTFQHGRALVRPDIFFRHQQQYRLLEVKSS